MSELISGKEAKLAWANGENVEYMPLSKWDTLGGSTPLSIFERDDVKFRLKPRTIMIGDVEVPAPFEPKVDEEYFFLSSNGYGYDGTNFSDDDLDKEYLMFGAWRTEEEIRQVVAALRKLFKGAT